MADIWGTLNSLVRDNPVQSLALGASTTLALFGTGFGFGHWTGWLRGPGREDVQRLEEEIKKLKSALGSCQRENPELKAQISKLIAEITKYHQLREALLGRDTDLWNL